MSLRAVIQNLPQGRVRTLMLFPLNYQVFPRHECAAYLDNTPPEQLREAVMFLLEYHHGRGEYNDPCSFEQAQASALGITPRSGETK